MISRYGPLGFNLRRRMACGKQANQVDRLRGKEFGLCPAHSRETYETWPVRETAPKGAHGFGFGKWEAVPPVWPTLSD